MLSMPVSRFKKFGGVSRRLDAPDVHRIGPCATGTLADIVERQITPIHPANTDRIFESGH
jgi:hypothetical protein